MANLTKSTKPMSAKDITRTWHLIDVKDKIVGRVAPGIASILMGKGKASYTPHLDMGDNVVIINASKVRFTGAKLREKMYTRFSGYPGGLHQVNAEQLLAKNPTRIMKEAVSGMLPKNKLRAKRLARLYIFPGETHTFKSKFGEK